MAILVEEIGPFRLKQPAPFMPSAFGINGAAFYINAVFLPIGTLLFAQPKPLRFNEQRVASEGQETLGCSMRTTTEKILSWPEKMALAFITMNP